LAAGVEVAASSVAANSKAMTAAATTRGHSLTGRVPVSSLRVFGWRRSRNGSATRSATRTVGTRAVPTASRLPLKYFRSWKSQRKYHSGRGT